MKYVLFILNRFSVSINSPVLHQMRKFVVFRETEGIRNVSDKAKRHVFINGPNRRRKLSSFETDSAFL